MLVVIKWNEYTEIEKNEGEKKMHEQKKKNNWKRVWNFTVSVYDELRMKSLTWLGARICRVVHMEPSRRMQRMEVIVAHVENKVNKRMREQAEGGGKNVESQ